MLILQNEFGNDGYAFWFKLLSLLCKTEGQVYDYNNPAAWRLLLAETHVNEDIADNILRLLAEIDAIDKELYLGKIIWVQHLIDNLEDVYRRRQNGSTPERPVIVNRNKVNVSNNTQTKQDKTKQDKTKQISEHFETFWKVYPKKMNKKKAEAAFQKVSPDEQLLKGMLAAIERAKLSADWRKDNGQFIPYPATWLNAEGWLNEYREGENNGTYRGNPSQKPAGAFADLEES